MTVLTHLRPATLRALASAIEARQPPDRLCASELTDEGIQRLWDIFMLKTSPTIGFWRRYRKPTDA